MVAKKKGKGPSKSKSTSSKSVGRRTSDQRKQGQSVPVIVSAKTQDIISVLDYSRTTNGIGVGHIIEALPAGIDTNMSNHMGWYVGEVVSIKWIDGVAYLYTHFLGEDSKMDDWLR